MKKITISALVYVFAALLLSSCTFVVFEKAQPVDARSFSQIPKELHGTWQDEDEDLLKITESTVQFEEAKWTLGENTRLKLSGDRYYFNINEGDGWVIFVCEVDQTEMKVYNFIAGAEDVPRLEKITPAEMRYNESGELESVHVDPSPEEFEKLLNSEFLQDEVVFTRIDNRVLD